MGRSPFNVTGSRRSGPIFLTRKTLGSAINLDFHHLNSSPDPSGGNLGGTPGRSGVNLGRRGPGGANTRVEAGV